MKSESLHIRPRFSDTETQLILALIETCRIVPDAAETFSEQDKELMNVLELRLKELMLLRATRQVVRSLGNQS